MANENWADDALKDFPANYGSKRQDKMISQMRDVTDCNKKMGIRIIRGSPPSNRNKELTLINAVNFDDLDKIKNDSLKKKLSELAKSDSPLYAWAALSKIQKEISYGKKIAFLFVETQELFIFEYVASFFDKNSEFQKIIAKWRGTGFEKVVFLRNRQKMNITEEQIKAIEELANADYKSAGQHSRYTQDDILSEEKVDSFLQVLRPC